MSLALTKANLKPAAIKNLYIKATTPAGVADAAYYSLPFIRNGKVSLKSNQFSSSVGREYTYSDHMHIEAECMATSKANMLKMLDAIAQNQIDVYALGLSAQNYFTEGLSPAFAGVKFTFVCDGAIDKDRFVKFEFDRGIQHSEISTVLNSSSPTLGSQAGGDVLNNLKNLAQSDIVSAGFKSVTCSTAGGGGNTDNFGLIRNGKFSLELIVTPPSDESYGRPQPVIGKFAYSFDALQTSNAELLYLSTLAARENDFLITLMDGTVVTLTASAGLMFDHQNPTDATNANLAYTTFSGSGTVLMSGFDALFV